MTDPALAVASEKPKRKPAAGPPAEKETYPDWRQPNPSEDQVQRLNHLAGNGAVAERLGTVAQRASKTATKSQDAKFDPAFHLESGPQRERRKHTAIQGDVLRFRVRAPGTDPSKATLDAAGLTGLAPRRHGQWLEWTVPVQELHENNVHAQVTTASGEVAEHTWTFNVIRDPATEQEHTDEGLSDAGKRIDDEGKRIDTLENRQQSDEKHTDEGLADAGKRMDDQGKRIDTLEKRQKFDEELSNAEDTAEAALQHLCARVETAVANFDQAHRDFTQVIGAEKAVEKLVVEIGFGVLFAALGGAAGAAVGEWAAGTVFSGITSKIGSAAAKTSVADTIKYLVRVYPKFVTSGPAGAAAGAGAGAGAVISSDTPLLDLFVQPDPQGTMDDWGHRQLAEVAEGIAGLKSQLKEARTKADNTDDLQVYVDQAVAQAATVLPSVPKKEEYAAAIWRSWLENYGFHENFDGESGQPEDVSENWNTWWMKNQINAQVGFDLVEQVADQKEKAFEKTWNGH